ncbi:MAG TPA: hypothetical protein G4N92_08555 [Anaerolineae bacterium]|nr:hypothetical protein [Anaerolineae bacterium]
MKLNHFIKRIFLGVLMLTISACSANVSGGEQALAATEEQPAADQPQAAQPAEGSETQESAILLPKMILVDTSDNTGLTFYDLEGSPISEYKTPGLGFADPTYVHIAGNVSRDPIKTPLIFEIYDPEAALLVNVNDNIYKLVSTPNFFLLKGAPAQPVLAYTRVLLEEDALKSDLIVGNLDTLPNAAPIYTLFDDQTYLALAPLAIFAQNGQPLGIWYTHTAWGIGGDIIYPFNHGLYYYNLSSGENFQYLDDSRNVQGFSQDFTWAASVEFSGSGDFSLTIENLQTGVVVNFPLDPTSDRGVGYAYFSSDNQFVAWLEASGSHMSMEPNYHSRIRVGLTSGGIIEDLDDAHIAQAAGFSLITYMKPVGWLDQQTLLVEVRREDWGQVALVIIDALSGSVSKFAAGKFVGFAYP